jgi:hypothetical protein
MQLQSQVLWLRPNLQKRVEDVWSPIGQQAPTAGQERMWLQVVGDAAPVDIEGATGGASYPAGGSLNKRPPLRDDDDASGPRSPG